MLVPRLVHVRSHVGEQVAGQFLAGEALLLGDFDHGHGNRGRRLAKLGQRRIKLPAVEFSIGGLARQASGRRRETSRPSRAELRSVRHRVPRPGRYRRCCPVRGNRYGRRSSPVGRDCHWRISLVRATTCRPPRPCTRHWTWGSTMQTQSAARLVHTSAPRSAW